MMNKNTKPTNKKKQIPLQQEDKEVSVDKISHSGGIPVSPFGKLASEALKKGVKNVKASAVSYDKALIGKLKSIVARYTENPELLDEIESDTDEAFIDKLNIDSVDFVEIIVDSEEAFGIKIEDDEIKSLKSFDDLYLLIEGKVKSNKAAGDIVSEMQELKIQSDSAHIKSQKNNKESHG